VCCATQHVLPSRPVVFPSTVVNRLPSEPVTSPQCAPFRYVKMSPRSGAGTTSSFRSAHAVMVRTADGGPQATRRSWSPVVSMHHETKSAHQNWAPKPKYVE
jgi:hypothetical protein